MYHYENTNIWRKIIIIKNFYHTVLFCPLNHTALWIALAFGSNENNKKGMVQKELTCTFIDKFAFGLRSV
jgi:hypothetical protein